MKSYNTATSIKNRKKFKGGKIKIWKKSATFGLHLLAMNFLFIVFLYSPGYGKDTVNADLIGRYGYGADIYEIFQHDTSKGTFMHSFCGTNKELLIIDVTDPEYIKEAALLEIVYVQDKDGLFDYDVSPYPVIEKDPYEEDDQKSESNLVLVNKTPQIHNFHDPNDVDWVYFYGYKNFPYEVKTERDWTDCQIKLEVVFPDGNNLQAPYVAGFSSSENGIYYVRVSYTCPELPSTNPAYELDIKCLVANHNGSIYGLVIDGETRNGISGAQVCLTSIQNYSEWCEPSLDDHEDGFYIFPPCPSGTYTVTVKAPSGYLDKEDSIYVSDYYKENIFSLNADQNNAYICIPSDPNEIREAYDLKETLSFSTGWYTLYQGLNLFAYHGGEADAEDFLDSHGNYPPYPMKKIMKYDDTNGSYIGCYFNNNNEIQCTDPAGFSIYPNEAYALYMKEEKSLALPVFQLNTAIDLHKGMNWVGISSPPLNYTSYTMLQDLGTPNEVMSITSLNPQASQWLTTYWKYNQPAGDSFFIQSGRGYIVYMKKNKPNWLPGKDWVERQVETGSHLTHTQSNTKGPMAMECGDCHDTDNYPYFGAPGDAESLADTSVCDGCHSAGGAYNGVNNNAGSIGAKDNWDGVYDPNNSDVLLAGKEKWCIGCHDGGMSVIEGVSAPNIDLYYSNGHGRSGATKECLDCHDTTRTHIDGEARTYSFDLAYYDPAQSGVVFAESYRLVYIGGEVPLMIPANYNITFGYDAGLLKDNAFRLCFNCHDTTKLLDDTPGDGISSNFKASQPNPPRNYSYAWGSGADTNEHVAHIVNYVGSFYDSDWDTITTGAGGINGRDSLIACSSCHNVHGSAGIFGSTNEPMIRDGGLSGRTGGYGFSYVIKDGAYPQMTSTGATQANSIGAIFRNNTEINNMCGGSMCHGNPTPPTAGSYNASGSSWGTYLEYYRLYQSY